jgi:hypothetical protein
MSLTEPRPQVVSHILCEGDRRAREGFTVNEPLRGAIGRDISKADFGDVYASELRRWAGQPRFDFVRLWK